MIETCFLTKFTGEGDVAGRKGRGVLPRRTPRFGKVVYNGVEKKTPKQKTTHTPPSEVE